MSKKHFSRWSVSSQWRSSSSVLRASGSLYVVLLTIIQMVSRLVHITWICQPVALCYKVCKSFWHHVRMCAAFNFSIQGFPTFVGHLSSYCCARNFDIVNWNFFYLSVLKEVEELLRIYLPLLTAFSITLLTHLKNNGHLSVVCLLKSFLLTTCSIKSFRLLQQFANFFDWMARKP